MPELIDSPVVNTLREEENQREQAEQAQFVCGGKDSSLTVLASTASFATKASKNTNDQCHDFVSVVVFAGKHELRLVRVMSSLEDLLNKSIPELSDLFVRRQRPCT